MTSRDITTICASLIRLAGIPLMIWGPNKECFWIGAVLISGGELGPLVRALIPAGK